MLEENLLTMKHVKCLLIFLCLFSFFEISSQSCKAHFSYTISSTGNAVFANQSIPSPSSNPIYTWDTGNGASYTTTTLSQTVGTTYTSNGTYYVKLHMFDAGKQCYNDTIEIISFFNPSCPLNASITVTGGYSITPLVTFSNLSTGTISGTTYTWSFGDGTTSNLFNPPAHLYTENGIYGYTLTASNNATCSSFVNSNDLVYAGTPFFICIYVPFITFTTSSSGVTNFHVSGFNNFSKLLWHFGDNWNNVDSNTFSPAHTYFNGTYAPYVIISAATCSFTPDTVITITNHSCTANSAYTYTAGAGGAVQFLAPLNTSNLKFFWDFGDGITSNSGNPLHTYTNAGNYNVLLISKDSFNPLACNDSVVTNLNITGIPCIANSSFMIQEYGNHQYSIIPQYPYNISAVLWNWGDGSTSNQLFGAHSYSVAGTYTICLTATTSCGTISTSCMSYSFSKGATGEAILVNVASPGLTNGVEENISGNTTLHLFPNPSGDGFVHVKLSASEAPKEITIYDLLGNEIHIDSPVLNEELVTVNLSALNNGIYFIQLKFPQRTITSKVILSR